MTAEPAYNDDFDDENTDSTVDMPPWMAEGKSVLPNNVLGITPDPAPLEVPDYEPDEPAPVDGPQDAEDQPETDEGPQDTADDSNTTTDEADAMDAPDNADADTTAADPEDPEDPATPFTDPTTHTAAAKAIYADEDAQFWDRRQSLRNIRDYADNGYASPWGVLLCCMVFALHNVPHTVALPRIGRVGSPGSLNFFGAIVAEPGGGKGQATGVGADFMGHNRDQDVPIGTGEGLVKQFMRPITPTRAAQIKKDGLIIDSYVNGSDTYEWARRAVNLDASEVGTLEKLAERGGATLDEVLKKGWSGEQLGFGVAANDKRVIVPGNAYRLTMLVGIQPERGGILFTDDARAGGTPHRFIFAEARDKRRIETLGLKTSPPPIPPRFDRSVFNHLGGPWTSPWPNEFPVPANIKEEILDAILGGVGLDGHRAQAREKVAIALAILDGRRHMNQEDWNLSAIVMAKSDEQRTKIESALRAKRQRAATARGTSRGHEEIAAEKVRNNDRTERVAETLRDKISQATAEGKPIKRGDLRKALNSRDRDAYEPAIKLAASYGWITGNDTDGYTTNPQ